MIIEKSSGEITHGSMGDIPRTLPRGGVIVFNDSKVQKARLIGKNETGGSVECLLVAPLSTLKYHAILSNSRRRRVGEELSFPGRMGATIIGEVIPYKVVEFDRAPDASYLEAHGHVPLPPYIRRPDSEEDALRYQTVYARCSGSIAAPTAGLHFTPELIDEMRDAGAEVAFVTLHVGLGTFRPIRSETIEEHVMHAESYSISEESADIINSALKARRPIVAVGTTSVRTLESAFSRGSIAPGSGSTELFIRPGHRFSAVTSIFTNFHTPESSLIVMISAFAGVSLTRLAYKRAIESEYRFFSYGDAMLIR